MYRTRQAGRQAGSIFQAFTVTTSDNGRRYTHGRRRQREHVLPTRVWSGRTRHKEQTVYLVKSRECTHTVGGGKKVVADGQLQGQDYVRKRLPNVHESDDMAPRRRYAITRNHRGQPLPAVSVSDTQRQGGVNATVTRCWE